MCLYFDNILFRYIALPISHGIMLIDCQGRLFVSSQRPRPSEPNARIYNGTPNRC